VSFWLSNIFSGLAFGMLIFLLASGLALVLGLLRIFNLAHGSLYLLGSYIAISATALTGNFLAGMVMAIIAVGLIGIALYTGLLKRFAIGELEQVLLTFGCYFVLADLSLIIWGGYPIYVKTPDYLKQAIEFAGTTLSVFKLIIIGIGILVAVILWWFQERTRYGAIIRAGVEDEKMTEGLGININVFKIVVFGMGALLAGLAGVTGGVFIGAYPGVDMEVLLLSLIVVIIGGAGSLRGALIGAILIGITRNVSVAFIPQFSLAIIYIPMILILIFRPQGLFGRK
jgi:branched-chain amino acid transport system permease protein